MQLISLAQLISMTSGMFGALLVPTGSADCWMDSTAPACYPH
ncbi:hypothetical protein ABIA39_001603 [Nocardia sp. GAS34]